MRRFDSIKTLVRVLKITPQQAEDIRWIVKNVHVLTREFDGPFCDTFESVKEWIAQFPEKPPLIERQMLAINEVMGTHGIETIRDGEGSSYIPDLENCWYRKFWQDTVLLYCNTGETYSPTILYDTCANRFLLGSWGDWCEKNMNEGI